MADDRQPPHDDPQRDPGEQATPDAADASEGSAPDADATRVRPLDPDATQVRSLDPGATEVPPGTGPLGPAGSQPGGAGPPERWAARAQIPEPQPTEVRAPASGQAWSDEEAGRRWWAPIAIALAALPLLGLLIAGIWLIMEARNQPAPAPSPSPSPTPPATSAAPSPTRTATPTPSAPAVVTVPAFIVGISLEDAQDLLQRMGLNSRVERRVDPVARPGTVIATLPAPGTAVAPGSTVVLVVAVAPPTSAPPSPSTATSPSADTD